jgi:DNA-binding NtrC family response regulator
LACEPIPRSGTLREGIAGVERQMIEAAFVEFEGNKSRMARHLSISRWTLQQKLKQYGIN